VRRLFHLVPTADWERHLARADARAWTPPRFAEEGFVHLSFADQLEGTLERWFAGAPSVTLLELDPAALPPEALRLEPSRAGALFPHVYAPLPHAALRARWVLTGPAPRPPRLGPTAALDTPPGQSPLGSP